MLTIRVVGRDYLDLYENDPVNLKFQYADIEKIQSSVGSYSQSFRIPATQNNIDFFGTFFNVNEQGGYNPKRKKKAELFYNTVPIITGFIQLKQVYVQKENYADFEITFFGDTVDLSRSIGDQKLKDLDLSAFDHTLNYTNYTFARVGALFSGKVRYGLIDKGKNFSNQGQGTPINASNPLELGDFVPCLRVREIVNAIFEDNGFTLDSDFLAHADFNNKYTPFYNGSPYPLAATPLDNYTMYIGYGSISGSSVAAGGEQTVYPTGFLDAGFAFYDSQSLYDTTTDVFTAPFTSYFSFLYRMRLAVNTGDGAYRTVIYNNTDSVIVWQSATQFATSGSIVQFHDNVELLLESGKDYKFGVYINQSSGSTDILFGAIGGQFNTSIWLTNVDAPLSGQTVDFPANAPDIKQMEYLTSLQKMFNLVFVADKNDPTKIKVEPFNDYNNGGEIKDWSNYVDYSKDVVIKPTTDIQYKNYEWTYSEGKDYVNKFYQDNADRIYGRYRIQDGENDFSTSDLMVQPKFGAFPLVPIAGTPLKIFKAINEKGERLEDPLCHVVIAKSISDAAGIYINDGGALRTETTFEYLGHYSELIPDVEDEDLNFGGEIPTYPINSNPYDNLYNTYWREYVNQLYSTEARMMEAHFNLSTADIAGFKFSDQIWIKDSYWRILSIDYSPTQRSTSKVTLIKILTDVRACAELPYQSNANGTVTFIDEAGATGAPSQECCERFGYVYISGKCYQTSIAPAAPNDTFDPSIIAGETIESVIGQRVFAQGANIIAPNNPSSIISGSNLTLTNGGRNGLVVGDYMDIAAIDNILATGSNVNAFVEGIHRGGGWWHENYPEGEKGAAQRSVIPFIYEGDFGDTDEVELFIEGKNNNRLSIPDESTMYVRADIVVSTYNAAGAAVVNTQTLVFFDAFKKIAGVATSNYAVDTSPATVNIGTFGVSNMIMNVDTTTDTTQHRIKMHNNGDTNTHTTRIVCYLTSVLATW